MSSRALTPALILLAVMVAACVADPGGGATPSGTPASPGPSATSEPGAPTASPTPVAPTPSPSPSPSPTPPPDAAPTPSPAVVRDPWSLHVGECFDPVEDAEGYLLAATIQPCDGIHRAEVFGTPELTWALDEPYPGDAAVDDASWEACQVAFRDYVGIEYERSWITAWYYTPSEETWGTDDREVLCVAISPPDDPFTATVRGSRR